jgi:hypothetical protein
MIQLIKVKTQFFIKVNDMERLPTNYGGRIISANSTEVFKPYTTNLGIAEHKEPDSSLENARSYRGQELELSSKAMNSEHRPEENIQQNLPLNNSYKVTIYPIENIKKEDSNLYKQDEPIKNWGRILLKTLGFISLIYPLIIYPLSLLFSSKKNNSLTLVEKTSERFIEIAKTMNSAKDLILSVSGEAQVMNGVKNAYSEDDINKRVKTVQNFKKEMNKTSQGRALLSALKNFNLATLQTNGRNLNEDYFVLLEENGVRFAIKKDEDGNYINFEMFVITPNQAPESIGYIYEFTNFLNEIFGVEHMAKFISYKGLMPSHRLLQILENAIETGDVDTIDKTCKAIIGNSFAGTIKELEKEKESFEGFLNPMKEELEEHQKLYNEKITDLLTKDYDIMGKVIDHELIAESSKTLDLEIKKLVDNALKNNTPNKELAQEVAILINKKLLSRQEKHNNRVIDVIIEDIINNISSIYSIKSSIKNNSEVQAVTDLARVALDEYKNNLNSGKVPVYIGHLWQDYYSVATKDIMLELPKILAKKLETYTQHNLILSIEEKLQLFELLKFLNRFYQVDKIQYSQNPLFHRIILNPNSDYSTVDKILQEIKSEHILQLTSNPPAPKVETDAYFTLELTRLLRSDITDVDDTIDSIKILKELLDIFHNPQDAECAMRVMPDYYWHLRYGITSLYLSGV